MGLFVAGYVVQGSNGEYAYLSREERVAMVAWARKRTPKEKLIIAGSGCECESAVDSRLFQNSVVTVVIPLIHSELLKLKNETVDLISH